MLLSFLVAQLVKNLPIMQDTAYNTGDPSSTSGSGRSPGEGNGDPVQYSCLGNSMDIGAWQATVLGVAKRWIKLSNEHTHLCSQGLRDPAGVKTGQFSSHLPPGLNFHEDVHFPE